MARKLLVWSLNDIKECIETMTSPEVKFDCIIFIEGNRGLGKSTLGYKILDGLNVQQPFKPNRDLVYSQDDTLRCLATYINGCIFSDEMINVAYKRDFYETKQKDLLKGFDMYRDSTNVFLGCIPKFTDLDTKIQKVCKIRLTVLRRGLALVQIQNPTIYSTDPWDVKNNQKIESKWALKGTKKPRYSQLTTVVGVLRFGDLSSKQRRIYDAIKHKKRGKVFQKYQDQDMLYDPEQLFLNNITEQLKAGQITPKSFDLLCKVNNKKSDIIRRKINAKLKEEGNKKTWRDYCLSEKTKKRKDQLGFNMPKPIEMKSEEIIEQKSEEKNKELEPAKIDPIKPANEEDVFGFHS